LNAIFSLEDWVYWDDQCVSPKPFIHFGESPDFRYFLRMNEPYQIFREPKGGGSDEFFASNLKRYIELVFRGDS
ncbi:MAG: hypothetical protein AAF226_15280, partial [Verrucomicrobiota bacterium]